MAVSLGRQMVIFSADSARPSLADLSGLLMGPAQLSRMGGTASVSVKVDSAWRVHALASEFAIRGLTIGWEPGADGGFCVRTSYSATLVHLRTPSFLDGLRLRLWFMASGEADDESVHLALAHNTALARPALAPLGLDGEVVKGPAIRIAGVAKRARLAELIGARPPAAPPAAWPTADRRAAEQTANGAAALPIADRPARKPVASRRSVEQAAGGVVELPMIVGVSEEPDAGRRPAEQMAEDPVPQPSVEGPQAKQIADGAAELPVAVRPGKEPVAGPRANGRKVEQVANGVVAESPIADLLNKKPARPRAARRPAGQKAGSAAE